VGLILFLVGKKSQAQTPNSQTKNRAQRDNNPLAILQVLPDAWVGLVGKESNGFLIFNTPSNGVRAGFINLYNRYIKKELNTISKIFEIYDDGVLGFDADDVSYIDRVSQWTGIGKDKVLTKDDLYKVGRAIERFENGSQWVSDTDYNTGYGLAMKALGIMGGSTDTW
jgi:hypothetical protein